MKKITFVNMSLGAGGAENVLVKILNRFYLDYKLNLFLIRGYGERTEDIKNKIKINFIFKEYRATNLCHRIYNSIEYRRLNYIYKYKKKYFINKYNKNSDIEIAFLEGQATELVSYSQNTASKKIAWVHTILEEHRSFDKETGRKIYKKFDKIICVSEAVKKSFEKLYPEYSSKIKVIYNPIDKNEIKQKAQEKILEDFKKNKLTIITSGSLTYPKGFDLLLKAHKELIQEGLDYQLFILGEGIERKSLEEFIKINKLEDHTKLLGYKKNPYPYIKNADIFISASRYEGYSLALCEALVLEKPSIATDCGGPKEILGEGKYGILVKKNNVDSLKEGMRKMILNEELRKTYTKLAKKRSEVFNIELVMKQIENLF